MDLDRFPSTHGACARPNAWSSSPGELHPEALTEPCLSLSAHTALAFRESGTLPAMTKQFLLLPVDHIAHCVNGLSPSLHGHYPASSLLRDSPPLRFRIRTLTLVGLPLEASPLASESQVLRFSGSQVLRFSGSHVPFNCLMASSGHLSCRTPLHP
jgi:hypothetical protein